MRQGERVVSSTFGPAQVRMVVLEAWACTDDEGEIHVEHDLRPVVGVAAEVYEQFSRADEDQVDDVPYDLPLRLSLAALEEQGWDFEGSGVRYLPCWFTRDGTLLTDLEQHRAGERGRVRIIAAPWPPDQDEEMLSEVIREAEEEARRDELRSQEQKAKS
jgi:hypothetical protein